jgi:hypothetical protein
MKRLSRQPWNILSSGNNTGILSSGNNTGILSSGNNTGILSSGNNTGILSSGNNTGFSGLMSVGRGLLNRASKALSFMSSWGLGGGLVSSLFGGSSRSGSSNRSSSPLQMGEGGPEASSWNRGRSGGSFLSSAKTARREEKEGQRTGNRDATQARRTEAAADREAEVQHKQARAAELVEAVEGGEASEAEVEKLTQEVETADRPTAEAEAATDGTGNSHEVQGPTPEIPQTTSNGGLLPEWDD